MEKHTALIVGANGIIGKNLVEHLTVQGSWDVIASTRSELHYDTKAQFVPLDLNDSDSVSEMGEKLKQVTHVFFTAYTERQDPYEQSAANLKLLKNLVLGLEKVTPQLKRILFIQGGKAYGAHLGIYKTPPMKQIRGALRPISITIRRISYARSRKAKAGPGRPYAQISSLVSPSAIR